MRLLRSLPSIPTRFPAFEISCFICSFQLKRSSKTIPKKKTRLITQNPLNHCRFVNLLLHDQTPYKRTRTSGTWGTCIFLCKKNWWYELKTEKTSTVWNFVFGFKEDYIRGELGFFIVLVVQPPVSQWASVNMQTCPCYAMAKYKDLLGNVYSPSRPQNELI